MSLHTWLSSSLVRHYPATPARRNATLRLDAARNERLSAQVALRWEPEAGGMIPAPLEVRIEVEAPPPYRVRVRRVGFVPVRHLNTNMPLDEIDGWGHIPGYVPDPLFDDTTLRLPAGETHAFWLSLQPAEPAAPGEYTIEVRVVPTEGKPKTHRLTVRVHGVSLEPRRDFAVTHWFYNDAILDAHRCATFDERFWSILPRYVRNVVEHGQDTLYTPVFTPPLDGVKRPSQLLIVSKLGADTYSFDWRDVKRYVDLARNCGVRNFEWTHLFTQWGVKHAIRIYEGQGASEVLLWPADTPATSAKYRAFLGRFLPELRCFLEAENLLGCSFFHVSDEPHGAEHLANYRAARVLLRELAPWMKVMDALSQIEFARQGLTDMPIPSIQTALDFQAERIPSWCYYCCGPRGRFLNRLLDNSLAKIRMNGWLFYRWPFQGFLHWGYNYWYESQTRNLIDPFTVQDGRRWPGWAYGDCFMVYPGPDGPIDSLRWEVFGDSLQDYALLQTLDTDRDSALLQPLRSFQDFPKSEAWIRSARRRLLGWRSSRKV